MLMSTAQVSDSGSDKQWWKESQQKQLDGVSQTNHTLRAAFPGSYLFNHILAPSTASPLVRAAELTLPDVSDIVYGYCSDTERSIVSGDTIVIDADGETASPEVVSTVSNMISNFSAAKISLLGESALNVYASHLQKACGSEIEISVIEPDWKSPVNLHGIYRQASTVIFVNTMRVLDAAFTRCHCTLVADDTFASDPSFGVLQQLLQKVGCEVLDESGIAREIDTDLHSVSQVIDNTAYALNQSVLQRNDQVVISNRAANDRAINNNKTDVCDWLDNHVKSNSNAIIKPVHTSLNGQSRAHERRARLRRKTAKLSDDPKAFLRDSNYTVLRFVGRMLSPKRNPG